MPDATPRELRYYVTMDEKYPFIRWLKSIKDQQDFNRLRVRLERVEDGNLGDHGPVGENVWEFRFFFGPAYRIYYGEDREDQKDLIVLLNGGIKATQQADIEKAKEYWRDYNA
jgi:putative addiction module killer protein